MVIASELIINILRVLLVRKMMELFLAVQEEDGKRVWAGFAFYYLLTVILYGIFNISIVYEICNYLGIMAVTLLYPIENSDLTKVQIKRFVPRGAFFNWEVWKKRFWVSLVVFSTDLACALVVYFAFPWGYAVQQQAIQTLLFLTCVTIAGRVSRPADSREIDLDKGQTGLLILIPGASVFILGVLLYGGYEGKAAMLICIAMLAVNLGIFYLHHMMAENYRNIRENDLYRQQTYAYRNQLDVIMESQGRIRALRHDMKNHILALQALLRKGDWEEADRYLESMQDFMTNPSEYITTGNESVDSLLNYKLQRAKEILRTVEVRVCIPEKLALHSFDLNVVLGNLLDNAVEAACRTEEKLLRAEISLEKGILYINIRNSCQGIADGKARHLETTKEDASEHGIGLGNVRRIVEKYHGEMDLVCENGCMEADIILYINEM